MELYGIYFDLKVAPMSLLLRSVAYGCGVVLGSMGPRHVRLRQIRSNWPSHNDSLHRNSESSLYWYLVPENCKPTPRRLSLRPVETR